jgi:PKD repeat protein
MKKILLSLALSMITIIGMSQTVPRQYVVVEVATGTWCYYCPAASTGVEDLLKHGCQVCVIENHDGDSYANTYSNSRNAMYNVSGVPSTTFDGVLGIVGGNHTGTMYPQFKQKYDQRIAVQSPITIEMTVTNTSGLDYEATVTVTKVGTISGSNVRVHFVVTQSHIPQNWQGLTELNFVNRKMVPDQNGTVIDFTSGNVQTINLSFTIAPNWPKENLEFIAFYQNMDDNQGTIPGTNNPPYGSLQKYEIYHGTKLPGIPLTPDFSADPVSVAPGGYVTFSNLTTGGFQFVPDTLYWYFPGGVPETSTEASPTIQYPVCGKYDVKLVVDKGIEMDSIIKTEYISVGPVINILADPGDSACWYEPITLTAISPTGVSYEWQPGGATTPSITVTAGEYGLGSHTFTCTVTDANSCVNDQSVDIFFDECLGIPEKVTDPTLSVYPNPNTGTFTLEMNSPANGSYNLKVINPLNVTVYEEQIAISGKMTKTISLKDASKGVYYLILQDGKKKAVQKILVD